MPSTDGLHPSRSGAPAQRLVRVVLALALTTLGLTGCSTDDTEPISSKRTARSSAKSTTTTTTLPPVAVLPGMPPVVDRTNLYSEIAPADLSPATVGALPRIYVPNRGDNTVSVIDPATLEVVDTFDVGTHPQHIVPSWDLQTLWVTNNAEGSTEGSLSPIDPRTAQVGGAIEVDDPYNLYFTPDGRSAVVVAEALLRLDFRDPKTLELQSSLAVEGCDGINHGDYALDGTFAIFTCEFNGSLVKIDIANRTVVGYLPLSGGGMPQDIRVSADGRTFYVAEMMRGGVYTVDPYAFVETGFIPTGIGAHGLYPNRQGTALFVANRGQDHVGGNVEDGPGSVSVIDFATSKVTATWPVPDGGSPDMGNVSVDGGTLWLSGRYDDEVYAINTTDGSMIKIPVGSEPHGLAVWPQPGRYSLGHTGNMR